MSKVLNILEDIPSQDYCTLYSIAHVTDNSVDAVWDKAQDVWKINFGMHSGQISSVLDMLGYQYGRIRTDLMYKPRNPSDSFVPINLGALKQLLQKEPSNKRFLISTRNHSIAYKDGKLVDTANRSDRVQIGDVYEVEKK